MKRRKKVTERMIGDMLPTTGEFMVSDAFLTRLAAGLRWGDGSPLEPIDAAEFLADAMIRAGLLREESDPEDRRRRLYRTDRGAALDVNKWNRAVHRAILDMSALTFSEARSDKDRR